MEGRVLKENSYVKYFANVERCLFLIAGLSVFYAAYIAVYYSGQELLEQHSFRQTQTALTSYWFGKNGFGLAYETPVGGAPWSIPFEFPVYQYLVSIVSNFLGGDLGATGRIISFVFLGLCVFPVKSICRSLGVSKKAFYVFVALLFSSPLYLFWGRTFMIETAALLFAVVAIRFFVDFLNGGGLKEAVGFVFFIVFSILQKATTGLPVLAVMAVVYFFYEINKNLSLIKCFSVRNFLVALFLFGVPLAVGASWTIYTDLLKAENEFGLQITSSALSRWNWGTISQRLSMELYGTVLWGRIFKENLSGVLGLAIIMAGVFFAAKKQTKIVIIISVLLGILPLLFFSNLHIVHDYYQSANVIFLIFALAVSLVDAFDEVDSKGGVLILAVVMVVNNYISFAGGYFKAVREVYTVENTKDLAVSFVLKKNMQDDEAFVAYGNDWNSSFAYFSERKSFTVPVWFKDYDEVLLSPEKYLGGYSLGGVVLCPVNNGPTVRQLVEWSSARGWKISEVTGCYISLPEKRALSSGAGIKVASCQGSLEYVGKVGGSIPNAAMVTGWTTISAETDLVPERVYVTLTDGAGVMTYHEAVQYPRPDVNKAFSRPDLGDSGFGRIFDTSSLAGGYGVGIARAHEGKLELCQFKEKLQVNN